MQECEHVWVEEPLAVICKWCKLHRCWEDRTVATGLDNIMDYFWEVNS